MKKIFALFALVILFSCSSDEQPGKGFSFSGRFYELDHISIMPGPLVNESTASDQKIFIFSNSAGETGLSFFQISVVMPTIEAGTYAITTTPWYAFMANRYLDESDGIFKYDETILDSDSTDGALHISSGSLTIKSKTDTEISIAIRLSRNDGKIITGNYTGPY